MKKLLAIFDLCPKWLRHILLAFFSLCMGLAVSLMVLWLNFDSLGKVWEWIGKHPSYLLLTALIYGLLTYLLGVIIGRLWIAALIVSVLGMGLALVDYLKTVINGTPLSLADFGLVTQLGEVAGVAGDLTPPRDFFLGFAALLVCVAVLFILRRATRVSLRARIAGGILCLAMLVVLFIPAPAAVVGDLFGVDVYTRMSPAGNKQFYGMTLALWRDAVVQSVPEPENYSEEYMQEVLSRIDELLLAEEVPAPAVAEGVQPNVIMILSEAFFDLTKLPDLTFSSDPAENFHRLQQESISGDFYTHYLGYGTGYLEMAMQYGISNRDFGPGTNICFMEDEVYEYFRSLPDQYLKSGVYRAEMLHAYNDSLYNRTVTYPMLGYSSLLFSADVQQLPIEWDGSVYGGYYLCDSFFYKGVLNRMEGINAAGDRAFLYAITMENHQPFDADKFGYECQIDVESSTLSEEDMAIVRVMLEGMTRADQALGELTAALQESEEPTVVVFFGDHRPNLFMTDGETVYTKLGISPSSDTTEWTAETIGELYSTDYLIWANDAARDAGFTAQDTPSSITAIGGDLLSFTGTEVSRYWGLSRLIGNISLTDQDLFFVDGSGTPCFSADDAGLSAEAQELFELRNAVIYDAFYGKQYITQALNLPAGS